VLVLTRKLGECIYIGDNVTVMVTQIDRGSVRIGIEAPREVVVLRAELDGRQPPEPPANRR
jgi:carbon storage regulator